MMIRVDTITALVERHAAILRDTIARADPSVVNALEEIEAQVCLHDGDYTPAADGRCAECGAPNSLHVALTLPPAD